MRWVSGPPDLLLFRRGHIGFIRTSDSQYLPSVFPGVRNDLGGRPQKRWNHSIPSRVSELWNPYNQLAKQTNQHPMLSDHTQLKPVASM